MPPILTVELINEKDGRRIKVNADLMLQYVSNGWKRFEPEISENQNDEETAEAASTEDQNDEETAGDAELIEE